MKGATRMSPTKQRVIERIDRLNDEGLEKMLNWLDALDEANNQKLIAYRLAVLDDILQGLEVAKDEPMPPIERIKFREADL